jgi:hypothetical protein
MLTVLQDGGMVEIATISREGMFGSLLCWTEFRHFNRDAAGRDGYLLLNEVDAFRREILALHALMAHTAQALFGFVVPSTRNAVHSVEERLARRLLKARDLDRLAP